VITGVKADEAPTSARPSSGWSAGKLQVVQPDLTGPDARAPAFWECEIEQLTTLARHMRACDASNELEFQLFVRRAAGPEATGLLQRDIAVALFVTAMTLQRWGRGEHLPYPIARRAYMDCLADLIDRHIAAIRGRGVGAVLSAPRRGAHRQALEAAAR
jgi:hypothetical protein